MSFVVDIPSFVVSAGVRMILCLEVGTPAENERRLDIFPGRSGPSASGFHVFQEGASEARHRRLMRFADNAGSVGGWLFLFETVFFVSVYVNILMIIWRLKSLKIRGNYFCLRKHSFCVMLSPARSCSMVE